VKEPADRPSAEHVLRVLLSSPISSLSSPPLHASSYVVQHPFIVDSLDAQDALADLLREVKEIIERDGGLERALKKVKLREKEVISSFRIFFLMFALIFVVREN
jgi:hypothetical protein